MKRPNTSVSKSSATKSISRITRQDTAQTGWQDEPDAGFQTRLHLETPVQLADDGEDARLLASADESAPPADGSLAHVAATPAASTDSTINPAAIGAGVLGVAAVLAASGGSGSGGGSSSAPQDSLQNNLNKPGAGKPDRGKTDNDDNTVSPGRESQAGEQEAGHDTHDNTNASTPGNKTPGFAQASGPADRPNVAESGNTQLKADTFVLTLPNGSVADHVRISNIQTSHGSLADSVRMVRYGDDDARPSDQQGFSAELALKAPGDEAAVNTTQTGYEVYVPAAGPVTLAQARALADKLGGKLLVIDDRKEADWLQNAFKHQLHDHKVWIESHALQPANVAQRTGPQNQLTLTYSTEADPSAKLAAFIIEYPNYQHPLMLKKDGKLLPVTEGQIISKADLDKLVWNADNNAHATLVIEAVDSADPATANPIEHGNERIARVIKLSEDASITPAPTTEGEPGQSGNPPGGHPQGGHGHGTGEHTPGHNDQNGQGGHGNQHQGGAQGGSNAQPGAGANPNAGGNQNGDDPRNGSDGANDTTPSSKPLPSYDSTGQHVTQVAHDDEAAAIRPSIFHGKTPDNAPDFILISHIQLSESGTKPVLSYVDPNGIKKTIPNDTQGFNLAKEVYETLRWDSTAQNSGSFSFVPSDAQGNALPGAVKQNVSVRELPAPSSNPTDEETGDVPPSGVPSYDNTPTIEASHDDDAVLIGDARFKGDNAQAPARFIEILSIKVEGDTENSPDVDAPEGTLKNGDTALVVGSKVADTDFGKISWDASKGKGGRFSFKPVADIQGTDIEGAPTQTVRIFEHPAAPTYESNDALTPTHDQTDFKIPAERLLGTQNPSKWVKIISINDANDEQADTPLMLEGNSVKAGTILTAEQVATLSWDASKAENGSIVFQAMADANGTRAIQGSAAQTLQITEQPAATVPPVDGDARTNTPPANDDSGAVNTGTQADKLKLAWGSLFNQDDISFLDLIGQGEQQHEAGIKPKAISPSDQPAPPLVHSESHSMLTSNLLKSVLPEDFGTH